METLGKRRDISAIAGPHGRHGSAQGETDSPTIDSQRDLQKSIVGPSVYKIAQV
jgi:hypothetical protein